MSYLIEVPVDGGGCLLVEGTAPGQAGDLDFATPGSEEKLEEKLAKARLSLEKSFDQLAPAVRAISSRLQAMTPDAFSVEFGLTLGAKTGLVVAKGRAEVHFTVTLSWEARTSSPSAKSADAVPAAGDG